MSLDRIFAPRGIAVIGASENAKKFGGLTLQNLIAGGYSGNLIPVNASKQTVMGLRAYRRVDEAPGPIDVAVLAVPKQAVSKAIRECAEAGISYLVMMTGGYGETGAAGLAEEREMVAIARGLGIRVLGPNTLGLASTPSKVSMNASLAMREVPARQGGISLVSQSGAAMSVLYNRGAREGIAFRHLAALGNQSDLEVADLVDFYAEDAGTRVIIASIEGLKDPERFLAAALKCHDAGKPVLVAKSGRTAAGAVVAATHTGSLASAYATFAARCESVGIVMVESELAMARIAFLYERYKGSPAGGGIALLSPSGGALVQATDVAVELGLTMASFAPETTNELEILYSPGLAKNPLDFANLRDNSFVDVGDGGVDIVAEDPAVAAIVGVLGTGHNLDEMVVAMSDAVGERKPLLFAALPGQNADKARLASAERGFLVIDSIEDSLGVLKRWLTARPVVADAPPRPAGISTVGPPDLPNGAMLGEAESKRLLARYGIAVSREREAATVDDALAHADIIGYPVVLKGFGAGLIHKSDKGAVKLNLADPAALRAAWNEISGAVGTELEGCVVAEMVRGEAELILGSIHDAQYGPMVMFGAGGILAELLDDVIVLAAPAHPDLIRTKLGSLRIMKVLEGARGRPACDIDAAVDAIYRLGLFAADAGRALGELDINPLIVRVAGKGAVAVDARIRTAE